MFESWFMHMLHRSTSLGLKFIDYYMHFFTFYDMSVHHNKNNTLLKPHWLCQSKVVGMNLIGLS